MSKLNVQATVRWAGGRSDAYHKTAIMLVLLVTDEIGAPVTGLQAKDVSVRFVDDPVQGNGPTLRTVFHEVSHGQPDAARGFYTLMVLPSSGKGEATTWLVDQIFLLITVRKGGNEGQTICLASYHVYPNE